ncbi:hypothetical protein GCM10028819_39070 [Spirosoma humi]
MNTEQNYVGKGTHANDSEQSAKTVLQTSFTVDNRQPDSDLEREYQQLYMMVSNFLYEAGTSGPVDLVNGLVLDAVHSNIGFDPESEYEPAQEYPISQADLARMFSANQLTSFLIRLSEKWQRIKRLKSN